MIFLGFFEATRTEEMKLFMYFINYAAQFVCLLVFQAEC